MKLPSMLAIAGALAMVVAAAPGVAQAASPAWPQYGFDAAKSGANPAEHTVTRSTVAGLTLDYVAVGPGSDLFDAISDSSPAVVGDVAYVGTDSGFLVAWPATGCGSDTCSPLWTAKLSNGVHTTPAVDGGLVFVSSAGSVDNGIGTSAAVGPPDCWLLSARTDAGIRSSTALHACRAASMFCLVA